MLNTTRELDGQSEKRNPADFALWKCAQPEHIMRWPSPLESLYRGLPLFYLFRGRDSMIPSLQQRCEIAGIIIPLYLPLFNGLIPLREGRRCHCSLTLTDKKMLKNKQPTLSLVETVCLPLLF